MFFHANDFQLNHLLSLVRESHILYGPIKAGRVTKYQQVDKSEQIVWEYKRSVMSFKKILYPNHEKLEREHQKIAFTGIPPCDIAALSLFLKQFSGSGLVPLREDLIIIGSDCQPDENCFCDQYDFHSHLDYDLFVVRSDKGYLIHAKGWRGKDLAGKCGLKVSDKSFTLKAKATSDKLDLKLTEKNIDNKRLTADYWEKISNNCFGCGACSTVCPLCFCFRQDFKSCPDGSDQKCLNWDTCFSADFSQIQFANDMRPQNSDRLYNWYNHKFVRGIRELKNPLCVGCGRCITACPAHLSIHNIIHTLNKKFPAHSESDLPSDKSS